MKTPLPPVLRAALYRRAVACAWLTVCERQHRYPCLLYTSKLNQASLLVACPSAAGKRM